MSTFVGIVLTIGCCAFAVVALIKLIATIKEVRAKKKQTAEEERGE